MVAETTQELGRRGAIDAVLFLWRVLRDRIDLPFNAYDHGNKLRVIPPPEFDTEPFSFDLRGNLRKPDTVAFGGKQSVEVFIEVKRYERGDQLLKDFAAFLKRAAITSLMPEHSNTWFIFLASVPFGGSRGAELCNGEYLAEAKCNWPEALRTKIPRDLSSRISIVIATASFTRLLERWGPTRGRPA